MAIANPSGIGPKRLVVGAHYGVGDFLLQRLTAIVLAVFVAVPSLRLVFGGTLDYDAWAGLFVPMWMKVVTLSRCSRCCITRGSA